MHELAITESIVDAVTQRLAGARVSCVRLEIGALSGVVADSVRFCFDLVTEGTTLEGARLEITETAGRCHCRACGADFEPDGPITLCPCGSAETTVLSGQELKIASVQCRPGETTADPPAVDPAPADPSAPGRAAAGPSAPDPCAPGPSAPGPSAAGPSAAGPSAAGPSAPGPSAPKVA